VTMRVQHYEYDGHDNLTRYEIYEDNITESDSVPNNTTLYEYDNQGNLTRYDNDYESYRGDRRTASSRYEYDDRENLVSKVSGQDHQTWTYDEDSNLTKHIINYPSLDLPYAYKDEIRSWKYDISGSPTSELLIRYQRDGSRQHDVRTRYEYDPRGNLTSKTSWLMHQSWEYDENDNLTKHIVNNLPIDLPYSDQDEIHSWDYDSLGNLISSESSIHNGPDRSSIAATMRRHELTGWGHVFYNPTGISVGSVVSVSEFPIPVSFELLTSNAKFPYSPHPKIP
jgi:YD repeat-containing protein